MTQLPQPRPSGDWRAPYAGAAPIMRDVTNFVRTSPDVPQNLLRVTRRGCDDCPTPEETSIMSAYSGLGAFRPARVNPREHLAIAHAHFTDSFHRIAAGLHGVGKGGGGGGGHGGGQHGGGGMPHHGGGGGGGHHHHGGRGGGGRWGGPWYGGGDTYVVYGGCPVGYVWDEYRGECVPEQHVVVLRTAGGVGMPAAVAQPRALPARGHGGPHAGYARAEAVRAGAALKAGAYRGSVGRVVNAPPSRQGAHIRNAAVRGALGNIATGCTDQGVRTAGSIIDALAAIGAAGASLYGSTAQSAGTRTDASRVGAGFTTGATGIDAAMSAICTGTQSQASGPSPTGNMDAQIKAMQDSINALSNQHSAAPPAYQPPPAAPAAAGVSTKTLVIGGGVVAAIIAAYLFLK